MSKKILSLALLCVLTHLAACVKPASAFPRQPANQSPSKEDQQAEKIKLKVQDLGMSTRITVIMKNGKQYYGSVAQIGDDSFQVLEVDQRQLITIAYKDAKKVWFDYGNPNPFTGRRWNPKWGRIALLGVIAMIGILIPLTIPKT